MKVAVLGANGYIGKYLTWWLSTKSISVIPVSRYTVNLNDYHDVTNWLHHERPSIIVNCATATSYFQITDFVYQDVQNNLGIFLNFYNNSHLFDRFINIGSGAEFDRTSNIDQVTESDIFSKQPKDSYGYSKNIIARLCAEKETFFTLRLFGCFDPSEPEFRLFQKFIKQSQVNIVDRYVDYISLIDFCLILEHYLNNNVTQDINCVYQEKYLLSEIFDMFQKIHNVKTHLNITNTDLKNYTGCGDQLTKLNLPLTGLVQGIKNYI
jgi:GDP-L-fucose synthase